MSPTFEAEMRLHYLHTSLEDTLMAFPRAIRGLLRMLEPLEQHEWLLRAAYVQWRRYGPPPIRLPAGWHDRAMDAVWNRVLEKVGGREDRRLNVLFDVCQQGASYRGAAPDYVRYKQDAHRASGLLTDDIVCNCARTLCAVRERAEKPYGSLLHALGVSHGLPHAQAVEMLLRLVLESEGIVYE